MAFNKKTWKDRLVEFAGRRMLKRVSGSADSTIVVDVSRNEGTVSQAGDAFSAANMNDLEQRIADGFAELGESVGDGKTLIAAAITAKKVAAAASDTFAELAQKIGRIVLGSGNAVKADVLYGKTFTNNDGVQYTGNMANNGAKTASLNAGGSYSIPAGYHNGSGKVTANSLSSQTQATATASDIAKSKTAWVNGSKITGTGITGIKTYTLSLTQEQLANIEPPYKYGPINVSNSVISAGIKKVTRGFAYSYQENFHAFSIFNGLEVTFSGTNLYIIFPQSMILAAKNGILLKVAIDFACEIIYVY